MADDQVVKFDVQTGFDDGMITGHVAATLRRNLPEITRGNPNHQPIYVYANGPSAKDAPRHYPAVALNGAFRLPQFKVQEPEYWVACDPQALVAGFIEPKSQTAFMVASKCHADVFDKLEGSDLSVWHLGDIGSMELPEGKDIVPCSVSVTICTLGLLYMMGYRDITVYGWDCCYIDGKDHAVPQGHIGNDIEMDVGDKAFVTTTTWACEAQDAAHYMALLPGIRLRVEGPGMVGAILRHKGLI